MQVRYKFEQSCYAIVFMLIKEVTKLVGMALIIMVPITYWLADRWLQNFAYRTELGLMVFVSVALLMLLLTWLTVGYRTPKAASTNPVNVLRHD